MHRRAFRLSAFLPALLPALLLLLSACVPQPTADPRLDATLLIDGTGVVHNGRPAASGERLQAGDWVLTGVAGSALVEFSDGTTVQIAEAEKPVYLYWSGVTLSIRTEGTLVETVTGAVIDVVRMITDLASVFNESHFITVLEGNEFRHFLLTGQARMIFPEPGLPIPSGQYALVTPGGEVIVRPITEALVRALRARLDRWRFIRPPRLRSTPPPDDDFGIPGLRPPVIILPGPRDPRTVPTVPDRPPRPGSGTIRLPERSQDQVD